MDIPETELKEITVQCTTPGCENFGVLLDVLVSYDAPVVICGPCGEWILAPDPEEESE